MKKNKFGNGIKMKVMTFNIQHCLDYKKQVIDIDFFADAIRKYDLDICGLNEVRGEGPLDGYTDQTNALGDKLGWNRYFGEAIKVRKTSPYGNAIVSKHKLKSAETIKIPDPKIKFERVSYETRCVVKAVAEINGQDICFLVCHMGLAKGERKNAVKTLCGLIDELDIPVVLMGDFNTEPDDKVFSPLFERLRDTDEIAEIRNIATYPSDNPRIKIDYIFYRGLKCRSVKTITEVFSDHLPIIAEFETQ